MTIIEEKYDFVGEYHHGVAIVVKDGMYGAILMGGHEIIEPCYDYISSFEDGYAQAIRKGECKILDLSGRECKKYEGKLIAVPTKYDSVREFKNGYACVQLNRKWGAIDTECHEIFKPQFYFLSDFIEGTAKYKKEYCQHANSWGYLNVNGFCSECNLMEPEIEPDGNLIIEREELSTDSNGSIFVNMVNNNPTRRVRINNKGQLLVKNGDAVIALPQKFLIARNYKDGVAIVQDSTGFWGAVDTKGRIVVQLEYSRINDFSENKAFAKNKNGKLCLITTTGTIIKEFDTYTEGEAFKGGYAIVSENGKHGLINSNGKEVLSPLDGYIHYTQNPNEFEITSLYFGGNKGLFVVSTGLLIKPRFKKILDVKKDCVKVEVDDIGESLIDLSEHVFVEKDSQRIYFPSWCLGVKPLNDNIFLGVADNRKWGLIDSSGETLCMPTFDNVGEINNDIILLENKETITVDGWRKETKVITKYGLYNKKDKVFISAEYDVCPEYTNGFYKITSKGLFGVINRKGEVVLKPEWKQIYLSKGYYIISKIVKEDYYEKELFGLANHNGSIIFETKYKEIIVLRKGLYKIKENDSWSIFNDEGRLTKETYDDIDLDGNYIVVSKNGLKGRLNENADKVIRTEDGNYIQLPSKFVWGYDFEHGTAKVFINGCENYVDKSFNIVIINENQIIPVAKAIDYLVTQDEYGCYIFISDKKYGLLNHAGECIIEAKYQYLSPLANKLYIAGIAKKENEYRNTYGIIDISDKTMLKFEYSSIRPYSGKVPYGFLSWNDEYGTEYVEKNNKIQYWLVQKNGYGLCNRNGILCLPPEYDDIQMIENGFLVKRKDKYGVVSSDYKVFCEPKYNTISPIGNGLWKVSIIMSQTYNSKNEVFGVIDSYGKERLEPIYHFIGDVNDNEVAKGRAIISIRTRCGMFYKLLLGIVDENYNIIVEPQYKCISDFKNGKATVTKHISQDMTVAKEVHGAIDLDGNFIDLSDLVNFDIIEKSVKTITTLKNGYIVVQKEDIDPIYQYCAIVDKDNNIILPYKYHRIEEMENGMFLVYLCTGCSGNYGLLNNDLKEVIAPKYANIRLLQDVFVASISRTFPDLGSNVGLIDSNANVVLQFEYSTIDSAGPGLVWICKNQKIGLATTKGKVLLTPKYGKVEQFENGYAKVNDGHWYEYEEDYGRHSVRTVKEYSEGKWGVINSDGLLVLPTIYDSIEMTEKGLFKVTKTMNLFTNNRNSNITVTGQTNDKGGLLIKDCSGNLILASKKYDWQENFNTEGRAIVYHNGYVGCVNEQFQQIVPYKCEGTESELILPEEYDWGYNSTTEFVIIEKNNRKGVLNSIGNLIISPNFDQINELSNNNTVVFACGVKDDSCTANRPSYTWSLLNIEGGLLIDSPSNEVIYLGHSLIAIKSIDNKYSIIDFNGNSKSDIFFDTVLSFGIVSCMLTRYSWETPKKVEGLNYAIVGIAGKYGIVDNRGRLIIQPKFSSLSIQKNNQFLADGVLINADEQRIVAKDNSVLIIMDDYESVERLDNGLLLVSKDKLFGCINQIGTIIIPLKYKSLTYQNNMLIAVLYDEVDDTYKHGVIDFQEKHIVPFSQQIDEIKIGSDIILYKQNRHWGAFTLQGRTICEPLYDHIVHVADNLIKVGMDGKDYEAYDDYYWEDGERYDFTNYSEYSIINWGLIDNTGNEILPLEYRAIADKVVNGLVGIRSNNKLGYVDITGHLLIEPQYKSIDVFDDGYAIVSKPSYYYDEEGRDRERTLYGVINSQFKEIIPCIFGSVEYEKDTGRFKTDVGYKTIDGRYIAEVDGKELFLDKKYEYCKSFIDTCAIAICVSDGHVKYGLIDKKSNDILPPIFSRLDYIEKGVYKFKINDLYGLVNSNGDIILPNIYNGIGKFEDNLACVQITIPSDNKYDKKKLYGYVDIWGNEILSPSYEFIGKRNNKYTVVMKNNLWGLFGIESHQITIIPNAAFLGPCMENLCKINIGGFYDKNNKKTTGGLWGYVSVNGQIVIAPIYKQVCGFSDGMAAVNHNGKWGFINVNGVIVVPCEYDEVESGFKDGKGKLVRDGEIFVFDKSGRPIESYEQENEVYDFYGGGYDDDTPSIYDNPYYNDNLDMDQQSIEFWNSL